jgi:outer membrane protein assembly factor BamB
VRAFAIKDGERRWMADMKGPLFAPAALGGEVVYIGDLKGVIHALDLKTGLGKWQLDLGADPAVQSPGMIYGGVTLQGGKLYVGTVNLEGPNARKGTCIACIGAK